MILVKIRVQVSFLALLTFLSCKSQDKKIIWEEDFSGHELNSEYWNFELGDGCPGLCGWGNNEPQVYTKSNHKLPYA